MSNQNGELNRLVKEGPVGEIFRAEQALSILDATGVLANEINQHKITPPTNNPTSKQ